MSEVNECSSAREMVNFLRGASRSEIVAVAVVLNKQGGRLPVSGTKEQILFSMKALPANVLWPAIEAVFTTEDEEEYEDVVIDDTDDCGPEENAEEADDCDCDDE